MSAMGGALARVCGLSAYAPARLTEENRRRETPGVVGTRSEGVSGAPCPLCAGICLLVVDLLDVHHEVDVPPSEEFGQLQAPKACHRHLVIGDCATTKDMAGLLASWTLMSFSEGWASIRGINACGFRRYRSS